MWAEEEGESVGGASIGNLGILGRMDDERKREIDGIGMDDSDAFFILFFAVGEINQ